MRAKITFSLKILHKITAQHNKSLSSLLVRNDTALGKELGDGEVREVRKVRKVREVREMRKVKMK